MKTPQPIVLIGALPLWACRCLRCDHRWEATGKEPPEACAKCRSKYWTTKPGVLKRGRPKMGE